MLSVTICYYPILFGTMSQASVSVPAGTPDLSRSAPVFPLTPFFYPSPLRHPHSISLVCGVPFLGQIHLPTHPIPLPLLTANQPLFPLLPLTTLPLLPLLPLTTLPLLPL